MAAKDEPQKTTTACPACGRKIVLRAKIELNRRLVCIHCGTDLQVVKTDPLKLGKAYKE